MPTELPNVAEKDVNPVFNPIKGRVLDDQGSLVSGANVVIKGKEAGTTSDENGNFTIDGEVGA